MLICLIGFSLSYMSYAFAQSLTFLYINSAIFGLCSIGLTGVPIAVLINRWFVTNKDLKNLPHNVKKIFQHVLIQV